MDSQAKNLVGRMYRSNSAKKSGDTKPQKNPNRVAGGIRGAGADTIIVVDESGRERHIPTKDYIRALEQQIVNQRSSVRSISNKLNQLDNNYSTVVAELNRMRRG